MRYKLRTLLIVLAIGPPLIAGIYWSVRHTQPDHGPLVYKARFQGNRAFSDKRLAKVVSVTDGIPLNPNSTSETAKKLKDYYISAGYRKANVSLIKGSKPEDKELVFRITEGAQQP